ncbi:MAG: hypothetical protein EBR59_01355 [Methylococcaceae bacterium]|nr:hypothetical protein [Methylococcaceae bacterium]
MVNPNRCQNHNYATYHNGILSGNCYSSMITVFNTTQIL